jgi:hypothetical protein
MDTDDTIAGGTYSLSSGNHGGANARARGEWLGAFGARWRRGLHHLRGRADLPHHRDQPAPLFP